MILAADTITVCTVLREQVPKDNHHLDPDIGTDTGTDTGWHAHPSNNTEMRAEPRISDAAPYRRPRCTKSKPRTAIRPPINVFTGFQSINSGIPINELVWPVLRPTPERRLRLVTDHGMGLYCTRVNSVREGLLCTIHSKSVSGLPVRISASGRRG